MFREKRQRLYRTGRKKNHRILFGSARQKRIYEQGLRRDFVAFVYGDENRRTFFGCFRRHIHYLRFGKNEKGENLRVQNALVSSVQDETKLSKFPKVVKSYTEAEKLTSEILNSFIEKIYIGEIKKIRRQKNAGSRNYLQIRRRNQFTAV